MDSGQSEDSCTMDTSHLDEYENRPFECEVCGNRFNRSAHLKVHLIVHTGERRYTCDVCGDRFKQSSALKSHMLRHTGEKPYVCKVCNKSFRTNCTLKKHSLIHTGEKPYSCKICGKSFNQSGALKSHVFTHLPEDERPFQCNVCNQGFVNNSILKVHGRHCGERRKYSRPRKAKLPPLDERFFIGNSLNGFQCSFCKKPFPAKSRLRIHLRTHTGERPYKCELCERAFAQSGDLRIHLYTHTGERPHQCALCDKGYTNRGTLNQHMRKHHKSMKTEIKNYNNERNISLSTPKVKLLKTKGKKKVNEHSTMKNYIDRSVASPDCEVRDVEDSDCEVRDVEDSDCEVRNVEDSGAETQSDDEYPEFETKRVMTPNHEEKQNNSLSPNTKGLRINFNSEREKLLDNGKLKLKPKKNELYNDINLRQGTENVLNSPSELNHEDVLKQKSEMTNRC